MKYAFRFLPNDRRSNLLRLFFLAIGTLAIAVTFTPNVSGQVPPDVPTHAESGGITFGEPVESVWEFGLKINSTGNSGGITATVPIPMNWPEQEIIVISEEKTPNVGRFRENNPTPFTRQLSFKVNRIPEGSESGTIRFRIKKRSIVAPKNTSQFIIAKKVPSDIRTFLKPSPLIESKHKRIRKIATELKDDSLNAWQQVEKTYRWVRDNIEYKFDTVNHSCLHALDNHQGDCGELSSLFIAICRAQGIPARAVWIPDHTYPEFYLQDESGTGHWFPCQAAGQYEFGSMTETKPILQKGDRFRMPGERKEVRYLRPTMIAKNAQGQLSIEWISRNVSKNDTDATPNKD